MSDDILMDMRWCYLLLFILLWSCYSHISPHTKRGQARIQNVKIYTPYYIDFFGGDGRVPLRIKWDGKVHRLKIDVQFILRPTSPRVKFPLWDGFGNSYTVITDWHKVNGLREFEALLRVYQEGDYRIKITLYNQWWSVDRISHFKVQ